MNHTNPYASPTEPETQLVPAAPSVSFRGILNSGLRLYATNFSKIVVITLIVCTPLEFFQSYMDYFVIDADDFRSSFRLQRALHNFLGIIATAGVIAVCDAAMRGERLSALEGLSEGFSAWPRMFWSRLVSGLLILLAFLALIIPGIYFTFRLALVEPVAVIEHASGGDAIKRSYYLTNGRFWLMLGLLVSSYIVLGLFGMAVVAPTMIFAEIDHWLVNVATSLCINIVAQVIPSILVAAYFACLRDAEKASETMLAVGNQDGASMPVQTQ